MQEGVGTNRYAYSFSDPVNGRDPSGHDIDDDAPDKSLYNDLYESARRAERRKVGTARAGDYGHIGTSGDCHSGCDVLSTVSEKVGPYRRDNVTSVIGNYRRVPGPNLALRGEGVETSLAVTGIAHYLGGTGSPGWESLNGLAGVDETIAQTIAKSTFGLPGSAGTINKALAADQNLVDIRIGTPSTGWELTAGAITLDGSARILRSNDTTTISGSLTGASEPFDFNANPNRSNRALDKAIQGVGAMLDGISIGRARAFEQNYYDTIHFEFSTN